MKEIFENNLRNLFITVVKQLPGGKNSIGKVKKKN